MKLAILEKLRNKLENMDVKYSTGKKSKCYKYNLCDLFDPFDD